MSKLDDMANLGPPGWGRRIIVKCDKCGGLGCVGGLTPSMPTQMCRACIGSGTQMVYQAVAAEPAHDPTIRTASGVPKRSSPVAAKNTEAELREWRALIADKDVRLGPPAVTPAKAMEQFRAALDSARAASPKYVAGQKPRTGPPSQKALIKAAEKRGRKRIHGSAAERQKAYRARVKGEPT